MCEHPRCNERLVEYWEVDGRMLCDKHAFAEGAGLGESEDGVESESEYGGNEGVGHVDEDEEGDVGKVDDEEEIENDEAREMKLAPPLGTN